MRVSAKTPFTRRRFCRLLTPLAVGFVPAFASPGSDTPETPAGILMIEGTLLLRRGRLFEKAASDFALAAQKEPQNPLPPLGFACACVSRIASLVHAATFAEMYRDARAMYPDRLKEWQQERDEAKAESPNTFNAAEFDATKPLMPPDHDFVTKDDSHPYRLTRPQLEARLRELVTKANDAWETGIRLAKTPEEKAQAFYFHGWGMRILHGYLDKEEKKPDTPADPDEKTLPTFPIKNFPTEEAMLRTFDKAIAAAPDNPLYWQSKGDALSGSENDNEEAANKAYLQALSLKPRDAASLWYLLYERTVKGGYNTPQKEWLVAREYLHNAQAKDQGNAWPLYEEASLCFHYAPYSLTGPSESRDATPEEKEAHRAAVRNDAARKNGRRAIDLLSQGNETPRYQPPLYSGSIPNLLAAAWHYRYRVFESFSGSARVRELARAGVGYAQFMAEFEKNPTEAMRAAQAVIGLGKRIAGDWPLKDDYANGKTIFQSLVGIAIASIGYSGQVKVYTTLGDSDNIAAVITEYDAFKKQAAEYKKALTATLSRREFDDY